MTVARCEMIMGGSRRYAPGYGAPIKNIGILAHS